MKGREAANNVLQNNFCFLNRYTVLPSIIVEAMLIFWGTTILDIYILPLITFERMSTSKISENCFDKAETSAIKIFPEI